VRATLLYNPAAGRVRAARTRDIEEICAVLAAHGYGTEAVATTAPGSAAKQAREAIANGATHIFACGGDGTMHDVLQGMVDEAGSSAARPVLGIIPMGSANALARHLGLSMSPVAAARQQIAFAPRSIPVGKIECDGRRRYFIAMAGAGPDGMLVYRMMTAGKQRLGRLAYYRRAATIFASRRLRSFDLQLLESGSGERRAMCSVATIAVRIGDLGGVFSGLTERGEVHHPHLQLIAVRPPGWLSLPLWFAMGWLGMGRWNPLVHRVNADEFTCTPIDSNRVHVQADGEWIGTAPMRVTLVHDAIRLLTPDVSS